MVFVLDKHKKPLMPCTEKRARQLLERNRAVVHKILPFTIRLKDRSVAASQAQPLRLKLDPGSKDTGIAVLREDSPNQSTAILLGELHHKPGIKVSLDTRRALRHGRRNRKTRYRQARFNNRRRRKGWLPPSLQARVNQTINAVTKLLNLLPITAISTEHVKFDTQLMQNPHIAGVEYQQGELFGYEVREYLLEKWGRKCAYCRAENVALQIEHVVPKNPKHGPKGTDRISNLTIACRPCNEAKDNMQPQEWLIQLQRSKRKLDQIRATNLPKVLDKLKKPLKDAAMMNATRWALFNRLKETGKPIECGTGARTKKQRIDRKLPKTHYFDACCVGASIPTNIIINPKYISIWSAVGRGSRKMCNTDKYGFPKSHRTRQKQFFDFQTGDIVAANIPRGKYQGRFVGRVAVRASGYFDIKDGTGKRICQGISWKYMRTLQRNSGWQYEKKGIAG
jgi:5-methylcytosine-specific restriction endonuclease McrA